jgi:hypothetical protein
MKNIQVWSRDTDRKILTAAGAVGSLGLAAFIGSVLQPPTPSDHMPLFDGLLTSMLLVLVWSVFQLVRPGQYSHKWAVAQVIVIPVVWGLLVGALAVWFSELNAGWNILYERLNVQIL